jgi:deoxyribodipyrimidine photo-lyase
MTREAGEERLREFIPRMGEQYTRERNFDIGAGAHQHVSQLSPYVRRRLILEQELLEAALAAHGLRRAEKFIQEVFWRGYFKGWLEQRPAVWHNYRSRLVACLREVQTDSALAARVNQAEAGRTGLDYFDAWVRELVDTGYLHNHARMWFASIWIFTLKLPWQIGADFFYRHLLDGDPASNTLGWRWVAGLHTRGKSYEAEAGNIARFTRHRFSPLPNELARVEHGLEHTEPEGLPDCVALRAVRDPDPSLASVILITEEDCRIEDFDLHSFDVRGVATLEASALRSPQAVSQSVMRAEQQALADTAQRAGGPCISLRAEKPRDLVEWAASLGARQIITPYIPQGPLRDWIDEAEPALRAAELVFCELTREWDRQVWPHSNAGFFKLKQRIPDIVKRLANRHRAI